MVCAAFKNKSIQIAATTFSFSPVCFFFYALNQALHDYCKNLADLAAILVALSPGGGQQRVRHQPLLRLIGVRQLRSHLMAFLDVLISDVNIRQVLIIVQLGSEVLVILNPLVPAV